MNDLRISGSNDYFVKNGRSFFYLADTVWSAFTTASIEEWEEYLVYRMKQGFNALQICVLPQWDASIPDLGIYPFQLIGERGFCYEKINMAYFDRARIMVGMAVAKGFVPVLGIIWSNYVEGTAHSDKTPAHIMPPEAVEKYTEFIVGVFQEYNPVYLIGGDTDFPTDNIIDFYYSIARKIRLLSPNALITFHPQTNVYIPDKFLEAKCIDFFMYQSGHELHDQKYCYLHAQYYSNKPVKLPVINGEPYYEGVGDGFNYFRSNEFDVRKAVWQSLLSGAKAGIAYGAHGLWGWHTANKTYASEYGGKPFSWRTALQFKGSWDTAFAKWIFETYDLFDIVPQLLVINRTEEIRMAATADFSKVVVYIPYNTEVKVRANLSNYEFSLICLKDKLFAKPEMAVANSITTIEMHDFNSDVLLIGVKRTE